MAVYHWRCAFLCYFLLHKQKKVNEAKIIFKKSLPTFCLDANRQSEGLRKKIKAKPIAPLVSPGPRTRTLRVVEINHIWN